VLGKLRTIQLIEADFQLLMRIFLKVRNKGQIERDYRLSKFNFGSRLTYVIDKALLEKRLLFNSAVRNQKQTINTITDLEACYDRQLPNLSGIIEESIGVNQSGIMLIMKVIPIMQHHIYTSFDISNQSYGGIDDPHAGTGQGNIASGDICRNKSCLVIKYIEKKKLGATIKSSKDK